MPVRHGTLTASTVATVTFDDDVSEIEVINVNGASAIYFTVDGTVPSVGGNDCYLIPAAMGSFTLSARGVSAPVIKMISVGTPSYAVIVR